MSVTIRPAEPRDVGAIAALVRALAAYERAADQVELEEQHLADALFGEHPQVFAHVAEHGDSVVGFAVWFVNFSTWTGRHGIYLEDLFVLPAARGLGAGRALLRELARVAAGRGYTRVEWAVLDWNDPAIAFYRHLGARPQSDWTVFRLAGSSLARIAAEPNGSIVVSPDGVGESYLQE